jgi:hypothetical protein
MAAWKKKVANINKKREEGNKEGKKHKQRSCEKGNS